MTATLSAHQGTSLVSREEVMALVTPEPRSSTHRIVPHAEVISEITDELAGRNLTLAKESYSLSPDGNRLFGVLDTRDDLMPNGIGIAIGIRNSHDRTLALGVCAGTRVFVCDNLVFSGEVVRYRKHTSRISAPEVIRGAIDQILESTHHEARWLEKLKNRQLTNVRAKVMLMDLLRAGACTSHQLQAARGATQRSLKSNADWGPQVLGRGHYPEFGLEWVATDPGCAGSCCNLVKPAFSISVAASEAPHDRPC